MLVFEGPDNSGKTTLASYVSHELGIPLYHFGKPPKNVKDLEQRIEFLLNNHDQYIFDRIPLVSEPVYSVLRDHNMMNLLSGEAEYYTIFRELNPLLIYCRPPTEVILEGHVGKPDEDLVHVFMVEENARLLIKRYDAVMSSEYMPPHWRYDYTTQEHDVLIPKIRAEISKRKQYQQKGLF